jgi:tetratricopeptide (TPR) repeat protein
MAVLQIGSALNIPYLETLIVDELNELRTALEAEELRVAELESRMAMNQASGRDHSELADVLARLGRWGPAADHVRQAQATPDNDEWLAFLLFQDGQYRESYAIYSRLAQSQGQSTLRLNAAIALALLGNDVAAVETYAGILAGEPDHATARLYMANAQLRLGQLDAAARNYKAYLDTEGPREPAERVRRILKQIAPELVPQERESLVPDAPPPPRDEDAREAES